MAEDSINSNKVICRSRNAVQSTSKILYDCLTKSLDADKERTEDDKRRYEHKFKEIYEKILQQNILVNGTTLDASEANETPVYEPVDRTKEAEINEDLLPRLDDVIVRVAHARKHLPRACRAAVSEAANHHALFLSKVKLSAEESSIELDDTISKPKEYLRYVDKMQLQQACGTLTHLLKTAPGDVERAKHLSRAVEIENANRAVQVQPPASHSPPTPSQGLHRKRPLNARDFHPPSIVAKVARASSLRATDFVVQPPEEWTAV